MDENDMQGWIPKPENMRVIEANEVNLERFRREVEETTGVIIQSKLVLLKNLKYLQIHENDVGPEKKNWERGNWKGQPLRYVNYLFYIHEDKNNNEKKCFTLKISRKDFKLIVYDILKKKKSSSNKNYIKDYLDTLSAFIIGDAKLIINKNNVKYLKYLIDEILKLKDTIYKYTIEELNDFCKTIASLHEMYRKQEDPENKKTEIHDSVKKVEVIIVNEIERQEEAAAKKKAEPKAAVDIQRMWRGMLARRTAAAIKEKEKQRVAAIEMVRQNKRKERQNKRKERQKIERRKQTGEDEEKENTYSKTPAEESEAINDVIEKFIENRKNL